MIIYKQFKSPNGSVCLDTIQKLPDMSFVPIAFGNSDYARFKKEIENDEAELQDADGNTMTADDAKAYIATLP